MFKGTTAVVFARLIIGTKDYGVHAFVVPIRNPVGMTLCDGIEITDIGVKNGWNAVGKIFYA